MCTPRIEYVPMSGLVLHGSCGERICVGFSEPLTAKRLAILSGACDDFRTQALLAFGRGGPRRFPTMPAAPEELPPDARDMRLAKGAHRQPEDLDEAFDPATGLGSRPGTGIRQGF
jgi:hypothetical protein